ncbi:hypothetical protein M758_9G053200, partial [Ceratodon purpureus]
LIHTLIIPPPPNLTNFLSPLPVLYSISPPTPHVVLPIAPPNSIPLLLDPRLSRPKLTYPIPPISPPSPLPLQYPQNSTIPQPPQLHQNCTNSTLTSTSNHNPTQEEKKTTHGCASVPNRGVSISRLLPSTIQTWLELC